MRAIVGRVLLLSLAAVLAGSSPASAKDEPETYSEEQAFRRSATQEADLTPPSVPGANGPSQPRFGSYDPEFPPPPNVPTFELSQDYPAEYDVDETFPWSTIDFRVNSSGYAKAVLKYCLEGNVDIDFRGQANLIRKWYHAPWMHDDGGERAKRFGREFHHGLTRERRSRAGELHPLQTTDKVQNWAVSLYSQRGGYTIGRTWLTSDGFPDPSRTTFPDNTVAFKLLFTAASLTEVPYLKNSLTWTANVNPKVPPLPGEQFNRVDHEMRLLQLDIAVKDPRVANSSGWIFGTFVYDGSQSAASEWWERLVPVGLVWGDDSSEKRLIEDEGSFVSPYLSESVLNASLAQPPVGSDWGERAYVRHFGLGGRLNGPVDNPYSSCMSCHGRAATVAAALPPNANSGRPMPNLAGDEEKLTLGTKEEQVAHFDEMFRTIRPNSHLETAVDPKLGKLVYVTVDYSLQLSQGIKNFYQNYRTDQARLAKLRSVLPAAAEGLGDAPKLEPLPSSTREESE